MRDRLNPMRALQHPLWWGALAALVLNDHVLKGAGLLPGWLTGKLSDVAGLVVAPVLLAVMLGSLIPSNADGAGDQHVRQRNAKLAIAIIGAWFAAVNLLPIAARLSEATVGLLGIQWTLWTDPSDLLTLPALGAAYWLLSRPMPADRRFVSRMLVVAGAVGCVATSMPYPTSAVSAPGVLLVSSAGNSPGSHAIDAATGRRLATIAATGYGAQNVVVNGVVYAVARNTIVGTAIHNEAEIFRHEDDERSFYPYVITDESRLFLMGRTASGSNEYLSAFDIAKQKIVWSSALPKRDSARISGQHPKLVGGLVIATVGSQLVAYDPGTGQRRWSFQGQHELSWPTASARSLHVVDSEGTISSVDLEHGTLLWSHAVGSYDGFESYTGAHFGAGSGVVAFLRGERLMAIDAQTRAPRWRGPKVEDVVVGTTLALALVEIDDEPYWTGIRMSDGKRLWKTSASEFSWRPPAIDEVNGLALFEAGSSLRALVLETGRLAWQFDLADGERIEAE